MDADLPSNPRPFSTPFRLTNSIGIPQTSSATRRKQDALKYIMRGEIRRQTWHFPTMEPPRRSDYEFEVEKHYMALAFVKASEQFEEIYSTRLHRKVTESDQLPASWPVGTRGHTYYKHLCRLLNDCVEIGHKTLDDFPGAPQRSERYHKNLKFVVYDRPTGDGINGAAPLKPDLFGGMNTNVDSLIGKSPEQAWWSSKCGTSRNQISYPMEVKGHWPDLVEQAATYARCLFSACPTRAFGLDTAFNHMMTEARFLLFHRSGLSSSESLVLTTLSGQRNFMKIIVTILSWMRETSTRLHLQTAAALSPLVTTAKAAGENIPVESLQRFRPQYHPPHNVKYKQIHSSGELSKAVLKYSWQEDGRKNIEPEMLFMMPDEFGAVTLAISWEAVSDYGDRITTHLYLPEDDNEAEDCHWNIFQNGCSPPEPRCLTGLLLETEGESLKVAPSTWKLFEAVMHAMLGWLNMYQIGYLHRDVSIGNVLMLLAPEKRKQFRISNLLRRADAAYRVFSKSVSVNATYTPDVSVLATIVQGSNISEEETCLDILLRDMGIQNTCIAAMADGDMSLKWSTLFANWDKAGIKGERSGTREFMSGTLLKAMDRDGDAARAHAAGRSKEGHSHRNSYIQSPIDDLESFFHTTLWAVLFNTHNTPHQSWREQVCGSLSDRKSATSEILGRDLEPLSETPNDIVRQAIPVLRSWFDQLYDLRRTMTALTEQTSRIKEKTDMIMFIEWSWHAIALRGVCDFLEVLKVHRQTLQDEEIFSTGKKVVR